MIDLLLRTFAMMDAAAIEYTFESPLTTVSASHLIVGGMRLPSTNTKSGGSSSASAAFTIDSSDAYDNANTTEMRLTYKSKQMLHK